ncbi:hypothetical protein QTI66_03955 [Variovorax sp. J22R133]|uniref:hypothetical protein n=1 Tax=Variovorax brevis TaxID=3053503 RepID=UPI00257537A7|nr:hypothetical protein [Variovorax sp. J22R133]MDM0111287.1 hypothetical protein [Variovorax sp. J22R133]
MTQEQELSDQVRGRTVDFIWDEGPTKGMTQRHHFHDDGTVTWEAVEKGAPVPAPDQHRPKYMASRINDDVCLVSYLSRAGYTLTVALNFVDDSLDGVASNDRLWVPVGGKFAFRPTA